MKALLLTISLFFLLSGSYSHGHNCIHDELVKKIDRSEKRILQHDHHTNRKMQVPVPNKHKIRIKINYSQSDIFVAANPELQNLYTMSKSILSRVIAYFEKALTVNFYDTYTKANTVQCLTVTFPVVTAEPYDLFIKIEPENDPSKSYFAAASTCYQSFNKRPLYGIYYLNFAGMENSKLKEYLYFSTFAHELTHILGLSSSLFNDYIDELGVDLAEADVVDNFSIGGTTYSGVKMPSVVNYAREFFNCPSITHVPLENEGGTGTAKSHWDKVFMPLEYMNPTIESPGVISKFTMLFLKGTGWYDVDYTMAQTYDWGKDDGCNHFKICPEGREYCEAGQKDTNMCSRNHRKKAYCAGLDNLMSGCHIVRPLSSTSCVKDLPDEIKPDPEEIYGAHSRCFEWRERLGVKPTTYVQCHLAKCEDGIVKVKFKGGKIINCIYDGQTVFLDKKYEFVCPSISDFCTDWLHRCPMDCYGNGLCLETNKCFCFPGYSGDDCGTCADCSKSTDGFILSAKLGGEFVEDDTYKDLSKTFAASRAQNLGYAVIAFMSLNVFLLKF